MKLVNPLAFTLQFSARQ